MNFKHGWGQWGRWLFDTTHQSLMQQAQTYTHMCPDGPWRKQASKWKDDMSNIRSRCCGGECPGGLLLLWPLWRSLKVSAVILGQDTLRNMVRRVKMGIRLCQSKVNHPTMCDPFVFYKMRQWITICMNKNRRSGSKYQDAQ